MKNKPKYTKFSQGNVKYQSRKKNKYSIFKDTVANKTAKQSATECQTQTRREDSDAEYQV